MFNQLANTTAEVKTFNSFQIFIFHMTDRAKYQENKPSFFIQSLFLYMENKLIIILLLATEVES